MHTQPYQPLNDLEALREENERLKSQIAELQDKYDNLERHFFQLQAEAKIGDYASVLEICGVEYEQDDLFLESDPTLE
jgi:hypothetical protein